jgi:hypothetical protein
MRVHTLSHPYKRRFDQVLDEEPGLQFIGPDHVGHDQIICSVISPLGSSLRGVVGIEEDKLVRFEQPRQHSGHFFAAVGRPWNTGNFRHMPRISNRDPAERLYPLRDFIDQLDLLAGVLVEQQVELVKSCSAHQPMMFLIERVQDLRVAKDLIQALAGKKPHLVSKPQRELPHTAEGLNFLAVLVEPWLATSTDLFRECLSVALRHFILYHIVRARRAVWTRLSELRQLNARPPPFVPCPGFRWIYRCKPLVNRSFPLLCYRRVAATENTIASPT